MMNSPPCCCGCGLPCDEAIQLSSDLVVCSACLLAGKFLQSHPALQLAAVAEQLPELCQKASEQIASMVCEAEQAAQAEEHDQARQSLLRQARAAMDSNRALLAASLLYRALRLPGLSSGVYRLLGQAAIQMGRLREAIQYFKTSCWLALKVEDADLAQAVLAELEGLAPEDPWIGRTREQIQQHNSTDEKRCSFCGKGAKDAGPLILGSEAAICSSCLKRLMQQDTERQ